MKHIALVPALAFSLAASTAFAQTPVPTAPIGPTTSTELVVALAPGGMLLGDKPAVSVKYVAVQPADMVSSSIVGAPIYNAKEEKVGEVADLVLADGDRVAGVVASVGGFLGIGESYVVLDPTTVVVGQRDGSWSAHVDTTRDDLSAAPKFVYPKKS
jgi:hypothetical protein